VFGCTVYVTSAVPEPEVRPGAIHPASVETLHGQSFRFVVIVNVLEPPPAPMFRVPGEIA
jgi:hypothetical protein